MEKKLKMKTDSKLLKDMTKEEARNLHREILSKMKWVLPKTR